MDALIFVRPGHKKFSVARFAGSDFSLSKAHSSPVTLPSLSSLFRKHSSAYSKESKNPFPRLFSSYNIFTSNLLHRSHIHLSNRSILRAHCQAGCWDFDQGVCRPFVPNLSQGQGECGGWCTLCLHLCLYIDTTPRTPP